MPNQTQHFISAEKLLAEGVRTVNLISALAEERKQFNTDDIEGRHNYDAVTRRMDELGKKARGIWAQAQVHATLAHVPDEHVGAELDVIR